MDILLFFEKIRTPMLTAFFSFITHFGAEYVFLVVALIFFWCINKKTGYMIFVTGLFGLLFNQLLKTIVMRPRPWVAHTELSPIKSAIPDAFGYSFPSGHTQVATTTYGTVLLRNKSNKIVVYSSALIIILVAISRMYLGVHYFTDVLFSLVFGLALTLIIDKLFLNKNFRIFRWLCVVLPILLFGYMLINTGDDAVMRESVENASKFLGAALALAISWYIDERFIKFSTKGRVGFQAFKVVIGIGLILILRAVLKEVFVLFRFNELFANSLRYFIIVIFGGVIWPFSFDKISKSKTNLV